MMQTLAFTISRTALVSLHLTLTAPCLNAAPVLAAKSDDFVDAMGINIKLDRNEYEKNWPAAKAKLGYSGTRHYRDGLANVDKSEVFRSRFQELFDEQGMKGLFIWGPWEHQGRPASEAPAAAKKGLDYVAFISGQNEPDLWPKDYDKNPATGKWREVLDYQNAMYGALKRIRPPAISRGTSPPLSFYGNAKLLGDEGGVKSDLIAWHCTPGRDILTKTR